MDGNCSENAAVFTFLCESETKSPRSDSLFVIQAPFAFCVNCDIYEDKVRKLLCNVAARGISASRCIV